MEGAEIFDGDLIAVDRLHEPGHGDVVLVERPNGFTVKRLLTDPSPIGCHPPVRVDASQGGGRRGARARRGTSAVREEPTT